MTGEPDTRIAAAFPEPPGEVLRALELLAVLRRGDRDEMATAGDLHELPRPWEPARCPDDLREAIWRWCDQVVDWLNHEYVWRPTQLIPPCWPRHPHIAHEIPDLAIRRWTAEQATTPEPLDDWHRYALSTFWDRLTNRLGDSGCRTGKHVDWPAEGRYATYTSPPASEQRKRAIYVDTHATSETTQRPV